MSLNLKIFRKKETTSEPLSTSLYRLLQKHVFTPLSLEIRIDPSAHVTGSTRGVDVWKFQQGRTVCQSVSLSVCLSDSLSVCLSGLAPGFCAEWYGRDWFFCWKNILKRIIKGVCYFVNVILFPLCTAAGRRDLIPGVKCKGCRGSY